MYVQCTATNTMYKHKLSTKIPPAPLPLDPAKRSWDRGICGVCALGPCKEFYIWNFQGIEFWTLQGILFLDNTRFWPTKVLAPEHCKVLRTLVVLTLQGFVLGPYKVLGLED